MAKLICGTCNLRLWVRISGPAGIAGLGQWTTGVLSTFDTTTEVRPLNKAPNLQLLPGSHSNGCPLLRVCVHYCECALGWVKCGAQILSMGHQTWPHIIIYLFIISLSYLLYRWLFTCLQWALFIFPWLVIFFCDIDIGNNDEISMVSKHWFDTKTKIIILLYILLPKNKMILVISPTPSMAIFF